MKYTVSKLQVNKVTDLDHEGANAPRSSKQIQFSSVHLLILYHTVHQFKTYTSIQYIQYLQNIEV